MSATSARASSGLPGAAAGAGAAAVIIAAGGDDRGSAGAAFVDDGVGNGRDDAVWSRRVRACDTQPDAGDVSWSRQPYELCVDNDDGGGGGSVVYVSSFSSHRVGVYSLHDGHFIRFVGDAQRARSAQR